MRGGYLASPRCGPGPASRAPGLRSVSPCRGPASLLGLSPEPLKPLVRRHHQLQPPLIRPRLAHLVRHVRHRHAGRRIDHDEGAAPAAPAVCGAEAAVAEAPAHRHAEDAVLAGVLLLEGPCAGCRGQEPDSVHRARAGHRRLDEGDRAGVAEAARRGDLGPAPGDAVAVPEADPGRSGGGRVLVRRSGDVVLVLTVRRDGERDAVVVLGGQPHPEVGAERPGHLVGEERARRPARDPADDLADEEPLRQRVVPGRGPRFPLRGQRGQPGRHRRPVVELLHRPFVVRQTRGVREQMPYEHLLLARRGELRPVPGDRRVHVEITPVRQHQRGQGRHRLGDRPDVGDGVPLPRHRAPGVREAAPDVHHGLTAHEDRDRAADVPGVEKAGQRVRHGGEQIVVRAPNVCHARNLARGHRTAATELPAPVIRENRPQTAYGSYRGK